MPDASGTAEDAPPNDLPEDEHDTWRRYVLLGAQERFRVPDRELNSRLSAKSRGVLKGNRRRHNRELLQDSSGLLNLHSKSLLSQVLSHRRSRR
jgi:hypothetical protein